MEIPLPFSYKYLLTIKSNFNGFLYSNSESEGKFSTDKRKRIVVSFERHDPLMEQGALVGVLQGCGPWCCSRINVGFTRKSVGLQARPYLCLFAESRAR